MRHKQNVGFAHLCEKVNLYSVLLYPCANKMVALTIPDANQELYCRKDG